MPGKIVIDPTRPHRSHSCTDLPIWKPEDHQRMLTTVWECTNDSCGRRWTWSRNNGVGSMAPIFFWRPESQRQLRRRLRKAQKRVNR